VQALQNKKIYNLYNVWPPTHQHIFDMF